MTLHTFNQYLFSAPGSEKAKDQQFIQNVYRIRYERKEKSAHIEYDRFDTDSGLSCREYLTLNEGEYAEFCFGYGMKFSSPYTVAVGRSGDTILFKSDRIVIRGVVITAPSATVEKGEAK